MPGIAYAAALRNSLLAGLSTGSRAVLQDMIAAARAPLYAVGGTTRDLVRGAPLVDIDLAIEDDAIEFTRRALPAARLKAHVRFRTASLRAGDRRFDVVTARSETYPHAGALPRITPDHIEADMRRRDFSVNAMALRLNGAAALVDRCGGVADVQARVIRVLHDASFRDDATRIFRAFRYATRLEFELEPHTSGLLAQGVDYIPMIGGERLRRELELMLDEPSAGAALEAAAAAGALTAIHPALYWDAGATNALRGVAVRGVKPALAGFALLASRASSDEPEAIISRLRLKRDEATAVRGIAALRAAAHLLRRPGARPSGVVLLLDRYPPPAIAAFAATAEDKIAASMALRYLEVWRTIAPSLRGDELIAMGVPEGPRVQQGLQLIRAAKLDGTIRDVTDERMLALRFVKSIRESHAMNAPIDLHVNGN